MTTTSAHGLQATPAPTPRAPLPSPVSLLNASNLVRRMGKVTAVDGVSVRVDLGAVVALVGPNGSGKTTLLRLLAGVLAPHAGTVSLGGHDLLADPIEARRHLGFAPDTPAFFERLTVREHLLVVARLHRLSDLDGRLAAALGALAIQELADLPAACLSRGQRQRAVMAMAIVHEPGVLLLDEPLPHLDPGGRKLVLDELARRRRQGLVSVISSHHAEGVGEVADRVIALDHGKVVVDAPADELRRRHGNDRWLHAVTGASGG